MSNEPGGLGEHNHPGQQGWPGAQQPQQPQGPQQHGQAPQAYPGGYGQETAPGWAAYPPPPMPPTGPAGYPAAAMGPGPGGGPQAHAKGFFAALFDFNFNYFATPGVVKVLYIIGMVVLGLLYVGILVGGFSVGVGPGLLALIGGAILVLFYLALFRVTLEFYYAVVRMSEDIHHRR
jgi:hypothetical protein